MKRILITLLASAALVVATAYAFAAMAQDSISTTNYRIATPDSVTSTTTTTTATYQTVAPATTRNYTATRTDAYATNPNESQSTSRRSANADPLFTFGLKAGVNLSELRYGALSIKNGNAFDISRSDARAWGLAAGGFFRVGRTIFLQPEIMFSQKGGRYIVGGSGGTVNAREVDIKFSNIDFPVLIGVRLGGIFRINAGPVISFRTSDNGKLGDTFDQVASDKNYFQKGLIGYQAGVGLDLGKLVFDVRYEGNVRDAIRIDFVNPSNQGQFLSKSNLWQATIGFKFL